MRVPLTPRRPGAQDGVAAPFVAILLVVIFGMAAFAVDLGVAYNAKRELQDAADAAALGAAGYLRDQHRNCGHYPTSSQIASAWVVAESLMDDNRDGATRILRGVNCSDPEYPGKLAVTWADEEEVDYQLGRVVGGTSVTPQRRAVAVVDDPEAGAFRPTAICSDELSGGGTGMMRADYEQTTECDIGSGNWRELDCPETSGSNSSSTFRVKIRYGCATPVWPVPGQPSGSPSALSAYLLAACPGGGGSNQHCLGGNTGNALSVQTANAWGNYVINPGVLVTMPILCAGPATPCDPKAVSDTGNNANLPIYRLASARVCAVSDGSGGPASPPDHVNTSGDCAGSNAFYGPGGDKYLVLNILEIYDHDDTDVDEVTVGVLRLAE